MLVRALEADVKGTKMGNQIIFVTKEGSQLKLVTKPEVIGEWKKLNFSKKTNYSSVERRKMERGYNYHGPAVGHPVFALREDGFLPSYLKNVVPEIKTENGKKILEYKKKGQAWSFDCATGLLLKTEEELFLVDGSRCLTSIMTFPEYFEKNGRKFPKEMLHKQIVDVDKGAEGIKKETDYSKYIVDVDAFTVNEEIPASVFSVEIPSGVEVNDRKTYEPKISTSFLRR